MVGVILPSKNQFNTKQLQVLSGDEMKKFISVAAEKLKKVNVDTDTGTD